MLHALCALRWESPNSERFYSSFGCPMLYALCSMLFALRAEPVGKIGVPELLFVIPDRNGESFLGSD